MRLRGKVYVALTLLCGAVCLVDVFTGGALRQFFVKSVEAVLYSF